MNARVGRRLLLVALFAAVVGVLASRLTREMADFEVPWRAGTRVLAAEPLYRSDDGHFQYKYFPAFAFAMAPLAALPLGAAKVVWLIVVMASVAGLVAVSYHERPAGGTGGAALLAVVIGIEAKFFGHELTLGQFNALMVLAVLAAFAALRRGRPITAGGLLAASVMVKPYPVLFGPYLLITRQWRAAAAFSAGLAAALALPAMVYGVRGNVDLLLGWSRATSGSTAPLLLNQDNVSIWAMWAKWIGQGPTATFLALSTLVILGLGTWAVVRHPSPRPHPAYLDVAMLLTLMPLCSPQGWDYGLLASTPAVMLVVGRLRDLSRTWRLVSVAALGVMGLSIFDLMGRQAYAAFMATSAITVCALILLAAVARLRMAGMA